MEAEALRRDGNLRAARETADRTLKDAIGIGHVWVELGLLQFVANLQGERESFARLRKRVAEVASRMQDPSTRTRIERRWLD